MEDRVRDWLPALQMLDHDSLKQSRSHSAVPDAIRINDDDRTITANAEAGRLSAFDTIGPEEKAFAVQQVRQQSVALTPERIGRTEISRAHQDVS